MKINGKIFIFQSKPRHVTPQIDRLGKTSPVLRVPTPIYAVSKQIDGKTFIFSTKPSLLTPQIDHLGKRKMKPCSDGFSTHLWGFKGDRWENMNFSSKPRCVTPQIDCLGKTSPVLMASTHMYDVSKEIDGKMFIFQTKPRHVTDQIDHLRKTNPVLIVTTHISGDF